MSAFMDPRFSPTPLRPRIIVRLTPWCGFSCKAGYTFSKISLASAAEMEFMHAEPMRTGPDIALFQPG
jgi:hypothetical protein